MNRSFRTSTALAALVLAGLSAPSARAQFTFTSINEQFTIDPLGVTAGYNDFMDAYGIYDAYYTVSGPAGVETPTVSVYGDLSSFSADGTSDVAGGTLAVGNIATDPGNGTGSAQITKDGNDGTFHYTYNTYNGDSILAGGYVGSTEYLLFDSSAPDTYGLGTPNEIDIALIGDWNWDGTVNYDSAPGVNFLLSGNSFVSGSLDINSAYTITNFYTDPNFGGGIGTTYLTVAVPEPGNVAVLASLLLSGIGFAARRRRK
jgi:hypothetical protein